VDRESPIKEVIEAVDLICSSRGTEQALANASKLDQDNHPSVWLHTDQDVETILLVGYKMVVPQKIKNRITIESSNSISMYIPKRMKSRE
jgi:hypothetical protein